MKVVINKCFGGFGLSPLALKRYAELTGRPCYLFKMHRDATGKLDLGRYVPITAEEANDEMVVLAFDIPNPNEVLVSTDDWHKMPIKQRKAANEQHSSHAIDSHSIKRDDPDLVRTVEELGDKANGQCAELAVVEIPDGVEWEISEYDGREHIAEVHRTWA